MTPVIHKCHACGRDIKVKPKGDVFYEHRLRKAATGDKGVQPVCPGSGLAWYKVAGTWDPHGARY